jgi:hypothetical protein
MGGHANRLVHDHQVVVVVNYRHARNGLSNDGEPG